MKAGFVKIIPNFTSLLFFAFILILCWNYPPAAKRLLFIAVIIGICLSLILIIQDMRDWSRLGAADVKKEKEESKYKLPASQLISSALWMVSIVPLIYLLGFTLGISIFSFSYCKAHGGSWLISFVLGIIFAGAIYFGFVVGMHVLFPKPILWPTFRT